MFGTLTVITLAIFDSGCWAEEQDLEVARQPGLSTYDEVTTVSTVELALSAAIMLELLAV